MAQDSISSTNSLILQAIIGMLIGVLGILIGVCCSFYCLRKQGFTIPRGTEKRKPLQIPSLHFSDDFDDHLTSNPHEKIVIVKHGLGADIPENTEIFQNLSSAPNAVYESISASASMTNLASTQKKSEQTSDNGSQEMIRSHSR
ncbi:9363_t:CDS:1 [Funneliformis geosporum]|uniref:7192_t:CDS:1 n=1 Tax=Funneliformis geosporum TaxID=1117311 RepID=A0A9W4SVB2_9GLOM|nr:9363_t:CDS:1 [Funneliformis geosporum]CAI2180440.1 7192_t:CDS:1 [Funneliformis geosporum]